MVVVVVAGLLVILKKVLTVTAGGNYIIFVQVARKESASNFHPFQEKRSKRTNRDQPQSYYCCESIRNNMITTLESQLFMIIREIFILFE